MRNVKVSLIINIYSFCYYVTPDLLSASGLSTFPAGRSSLIMWEMRVTRLRRRGGSYHATTAMHYGIARTQMNSDSSHINTLYLKLTRSGIVQISDLPRYSIMELGRWM
jgi:hypothetical protein